MSGSVIYPEDTKDTKFTFFLRVFVVNKNAQHYKSEQVVGRNKTTQAKRVVAFPAIRAVYAGNACSRSRSKRLIPAYPLVTGAVILSLRG